MIKSIVTAFIILCLVLCISESYGGQEGPYYRVFTETGGINVNENDISEGHKSYHQFGLEVSAENMRARIAGQIDGFVRGEAEDEDPEIPQWGAGAQIEYGYKIREWCIPYLGVRYDHIERELAPKYTDSSDPEYNPGYRAQAEDTHDMISARGGFHFTKGWLYVDLGTIIPFYTNTKSGNFGPDVGVGIKWNNWDVGYRFRQYIMTDNHFSGDESFSFYFSGCQIGYSF